MWLPLGVIVRCGVVLHVAQGIQWSNVFHHLLDSSLCVFQYLGSNVQNYIVLDLVSKKDSLYGSVECLWREGVEQSVSSEKRNKDLYMVVDDCMVCGYVCVCDTDSDFLDSSAFYGDQGYRDGGDQGNSHVPAPM